jgi:hypothetical protein
LARLSQTPEPSSTSPIKLRGHLEERGWSASRMVLSGPMPGQRKRVVDHRVSATVARRGSAQTRVAGATVTLRARSAGRSPGRSPQGLIGHGLLFANLRARQLRVRANNARSRGSSQTAEPCGRNGRNAGGWTGTTASRSASISPAEEEVPSWPMWCSKKIT